MASPDHSEAGLGHTPLDEAAWEQSAGRIGAAPPPAWGRTDAPAADRLPAGERPVARAPAHPSPPPAADGRDHHDPYSAPAFAPSGRPASSRQPAWTWQQRGSTTMPSGLARRGGPGRTFWTASLVLTAVSIGLASPLVTAYAAMRTVRARRASVAAGQPTWVRGDVGRWVAALGAFTVVSVAVVTGYAVVGASHSSDAANPLEMPIRHVAMGQPATERWDFGEDDHQADQIIVSAPSVSAGVVTATVTVCAPTGLASPLQAAIDLGLRSTAGHLSESTLDPLPEPFYQPLARGACVSGPLHWEVPAGATPEGLATTNPVPPSEWLLDPGQRGD